MLAQITLKLNSKIHACLNSKHHTKHLKSITHQHEKNLTLYRHKSKLHRCIQQQSSGRNRPEHKNPWNHAPTGGSHLHNPPNYNNPWTGDMKTTTASTTISAARGGAQITHLHLQQGVNHKIMHLQLQNRCSGRHTNHASPTPAGSQQKSCIYNYKHGTDKSGISTSSRESTTSCVYNYNSARDDRGTTTGTT